MSFLFKMTKLCSKKSRNATKMKIKGRITQNSCYEESYALCKISTIMHTRFEVVQHEMIKVVFLTSRKCCNQSTESTDRQVNLK